jgi:hypothetical protein
MLGGFSAASSITLGTEDASGVIQGGATFLQVRGMEEMEWREDQLTSKDAEAAARAVMGDAWWGVELGGGGGGPGGNGGLLGGGPSAAGSGAGAGHSSAVVRAQQYLPSPNARWFARFGFATSWMLEFGSQAPIACLTVAFFLKFRKLRDALSL